jgi:hypothetical protein
VDVFAKEGDVDATVKGALIYMATATNPEYLGHAPEEHIARQIFHSQGKIIAITK